jgi:membrane protease YdiL (CAAX protease family)
VHRISSRTIAGLIVAIALTDYVANTLVPQSVQVPVKLLIVVAFVVWARRGAALSWDDLGLARERLAPGLRLGGLAVLVVVFLVAVLLAIPATRSFFESGDVAGDSTAARWLLPLVVIPLGTALFEEVIFRGVLLGALLRVTTPVVAAVVSAVVFGFWHLPSALHDARGESFAETVGVVVGTIAFTTAAGLLFAWLRLRSRSLLAPLLAHTAANSVAYVAAVVAVDA